MNIDKYLNIIRNPYLETYNADKLDEIFSKYTNLDIKLYYITEPFCHLLAEQKSSTIIKFINMFQNVNEEDCGRYGLHLTLAENIIYVIATMWSYNGKDVYVIMDHLLKLGVKSVYKIFKYLKFKQEEHLNIIKYIIKNYTIIKNTRNLMNNHDILLFKINNDVWLINLFLLISKCKQKNLPKFIIIHKILYYYLLHQN